MTWLLITLALLAALGVTGWRRVRRARFRRALAALPGGSAATAIEVDAFAGIDEHLRVRQCACGGRLELRGERSEPHGQRVLRVVRAECRNCERIQQVWFDASRAYH